ncbi:NUDIX domain-containing protein [Kitasatospora aureofaciens]|uniref:NUDIX domain-containing protein n=1 Tax=Kitasatospora aureofaciens TaxID=1894 RepID=UPI00380D3DA8
MNDHLMRKPPCRRLGQQAFVLHENFDLGGELCVLLVDPVYREGYTLPGGSAEADELPHLAARRHLESETGLVLPLRTILTVDYVARQQYPEGLNFVYAGGVVSPRQANAVRQYPPPENIRALRWVPRSSLDDVMQGDQSRRVHDAWDAWEHGAGLPLLLRGVPVPVRGETACATPRVELLSYPSYRFPIMSDGIDWIDAELGGEGFSLTMVKDMGHEELAVHLGAKPGTLMDADTAREMLELSPAPWRLPEYAMVGDTGNAWAFAIEPPTAPSRADRYASGRSLAGRRTFVHVVDSTMDPPMIGVCVDGEHDWSMSEYTTNDTDHPLTRRLVAEGGFVDAGDRVHRCDESDVTMADVYRVVGEYYGLTLPRQAIADRRLPHAFTEPRVLVHPQAPCPACGARMLVHGGGSWAPGEYRLVCVYYNVRNVPGYPQRGCPGEISAPVPAEAVREEPNLKYDNVRMPWTM